MSVADPIASTTPLTQILLRHMESLRGHVDGDELYDLISGTLRRYAAGGGALSPQAISHLYKQLERYVQDPIALPAMRIRARLLQQHLAGYLPDDPAAAAVDQPDHGSTAASPESPRPSPNGGETALEGTWERPREKARAEAEIRKERLRALQRSERDAWKAIYDMVNDFGRLKRLWLESLNDLAHERHALEQKLEQTTAHLKTVEDIRDQMRRELERLRRAVQRPRRAPRPASRAARGQAPTLLRREEFLRRLDAEIQRIKRSARPLAAALMQVEAVEAAGEPEEAAAAMEEAARCCYAQEILASFRAYDILGSYGQGRFAILFPETSQEGAVRALEKARKRAAEIPFVVDGRACRLPAFVATLTQHASGDDAAAMLARLEGALSAPRAEAGQRWIIV